MSSASRARSSYPCRALLDALETRMLLSAVTQTFTVFGNLADNGVISNGTVDLVSAGSLRLGEARATGAWEGVVYPFALPALPAGATVISAQLAVFLEQASRRGQLLGVVDVYGLAHRATATVTAGDYYQGDFGIGGGTPLQSGLLSASTGRGTVVTSLAAGTNLANYLNAQYNAGGLPGEFVFLRLNAEVAQPTGAFWVLGTADASDPARRPVLTITVQLPDPTVPKNLAVTTTSNTTLKLTWQEDAAGVTGYTLQRSTDGVHFSTVGSSATTSFTDSGLTPNTTYYYQVAALTGAETSPYSATASNTTIPTFTTTRWVLAGAPAGGTGTYANPYNSIATALTGAGAGYGIVVRGGTYYESNLVPPSGTSGSPLTLMGAPGERAIISGFQAIGGWTQQGTTSVYTATINWNPDTLYVDMSAQAMARSPDQGWWVSGTVVPNTTSGFTTITDTVHLMGASVPNLVGGYVQSHITAGNVWGSAKITAQDTSSGMLTVQGLTTMATNDYYVVKDVPALINHAGEWAVVPSGANYILYFQPANVSDLNLTQARYRTTNGLEFNKYPTGTHDVVVRGLEITGHKGTGIDIVGSTTRTHHITIDRCVVHNNGGNGIFVRYADWITATRNVVMVNANGITSGSTTHLLIDSNEVAYNWTDGVVVAGDISGRGPTSSGFSPTTDATVSNNYIHHELGYGHSDGIQMYRWVSRVNVLNNLLLDNGQGIMMEQVDDTGTGPSADWSTMSGNVIFNTGAYSVIFGHSNTYNWVVTNNTIGNAGYGPYSMTATGYTMTGNITLGAAGISWNTTTNTNIANYTGDRNYYYAPGDSKVIVTSTPWTAWATVAAFTAKTGQDVNSAGSTTLGAVGFLNAPVAGSMVTNVLQCTSTSLYLNSDGVVRTITAKNGNIITFDVPLAGVPMTGAVVDNWKTNTNYMLDLRLQSTSPAATMSAAGGSIGASLNVQSYKAGDFDGDGVRDLPVLPANVVAGLPNPTVWQPPSF